MNDFWMHFLDITLMLGGYIFFFALLPSILGKDKPSWKTSLPTAVVLWVYCIAYIGNHLWYALSAGICSAGAWTILFTQVVRRKK